MYSGDLFILRFVFILLNTINLLVFYFGGQKIARSTDPNKYWRIAIWIIISYAVVMGLRFGRMVDYNVYFERYISLGRNFNSLDYEYSFRAICWILYNIGIPYQGFICFCSIMMIFSVLYLLKDYRQYLPWALLLFLWEAVNVENFIRWYLAFSFYLFFVAYYINKKYKKALLWAIIAVTTHIGTILLVGITLGLSVTKRQILNSWFVEMLFLLSLILGTVGILGFLSPYVGLFGFDDRSTRYTEQFQDIITGDFGKVGMQAALSFTNIIRQILAYTIPILMIPRLLREKMINPTIANLFIMGVILSPILKQVEILNRFGEGMLFFSIIVSSASYSYILNNRRKLPKYLNWVCLLSIVANIWPVVSGFLARTNWWEMMYIWNAEGRKILPIIWFLK